jgi:hypothetical protein
LALSQVLRPYSTQKKEGFIERVDIAFLPRMSRLFQTGRAQSLAALRLGQGMRRKEGNSLPLFLIALEKAVRP